MKSMIIVALALVAIAATAPVENEKKEDEVVRAKNEQNPNGEYLFGYETSYGTNRKETGELKEALDEDNKPHSVITVRGSYQYFDEEGKLVKIDYFADETGFHAEGERIPKNERR